MRQPISLSNGILDSSTPVGYHLESTPIQGACQTFLSGRNIWAGVWSENKPHLLNKPNYAPWDSPPPLRVAAKVRSVSAELILRWKGDGPDQSLSELTQFLQIGVGDLLTEDLRGC